MLDKYPCFSRQGRKIHCSATGRVFNDTHPEHLQSFVKGAFSVQRQCRCARQDASVVEVAHVSTTMVPVPSCVAEFVPALALGQAVLLTLNSLLQPPPPTVVAAAVRCRSLMDKPVFDSVMELSKIVNNIKHKPGAIGPPAEALPMLSARNGESTESPQERSVKRKRRG
jgi:hypothetical protein